MIRKTLIAAALAAIAAATPAQAINILNGAASNGFRTNGINENGFRANGLLFNGIPLNGPLLQGTATNGNAGADRLPSLLLRGITLGGGAGTMMAAE